MAALRQLLSPRQAVWQPILKLVNSVQSAHKSSVVLARLHMDLPSFCCDSCAAPAPAPTPCPLFRCNFCCCFLGTELAKSWSRVLLDSQFRVTCWTRWALAATRAPILFLAESVYDSGPPSASPLSSMLSTKSEARGEDETRFCCSAADTSPESWLSQEGGAALRRMPASYESSALTNLYVWCSRCLVHRHNAERPALAVGP